MKWKPELERHVAKRRRDKLHTGVIVRDVRRLDSYMEVDEKTKGISGWFRAGLVDTYEAGVMLALQQYALVPRHLGGWRLKDWSAEDEEEGTGAYLTGIVPYEQIESVDWTGDEYYGFPVLFCHFDTKRKEPYERLVYCERRTRDHPGGEVEWYTELADFDDVQKASNTN